jgi:hypothetical protein
VVKPRAVWQVAKGPQACLTAIDRLGGHPDYPVGLFSLIQFKYRWEWMRLKEIADTKDATYSIYLSSAWEDIALSMWFKTLPEAIEFIADELQDGQAIDSQTFITLRQSNAERSDVKTWPDGTARERLKEMFSSLKEPVDLLGRHDFSISGKDEKPKDKRPNYNSAPSHERLRTLLDTLPLEFWQNVTAFNCGVGWTENSNGEYRRTIRPGKSRFDIQFLIALSMMPLED